MHPPPTFTPRTLAAPHRFAQQLNHHLAPPGAASSAAREHTDPSVFTDLATSIAQAPANHVVCLYPANRRVLYARPQESLHKPKDRFHQPTPALVDSTMAQVRLQALVDHWADRVEVLNHAPARQAMETLVQLVAQPPELGMPVGALRAVLEILSGELDPASTIVPGASLIPMDPQNMDSAPVAHLPHLPGALDDALETRDPKVRPGLRDLARTLQNALLTPHTELDLGHVDAEDLDDFCKFVGMDVFLAARNGLSPPLTVLTLSQELEAVPSFASQIPTLRELVLPYYVGEKLDLSGMPALEAVWFTGEAPEDLDLTYFPGQNVRLLDGDGETLNAAPAPTANPGPTDP